MIVLAASAGRRDGPKRGTGAGRAPPFRYTWGYAH
jgi:hypothetical protein